MKIMTHLYIREMGTGGLEEGFDFKPLQTCFPGISVGNETEKKFFTERFSNLDYSRECIQIGIICQSIQTDRGHIFMRKAQIRFDSSHGQAHFNIDVITTLEGTNKKHKESITLHRIDFGNTPKFFFINISERSSMLTVQWGYLPTKEDRDYYKKQEEWRKMLKAGKLTDELADKFKREVFEPYSKDLRRRMGL